MAIRRTMDLAVGIDVGFSETRRSTGVVLLDRQTKALAQGSRPLVDTATSATSFVIAEVARLKPRSVTACVDGSFAAALPGTKVRLVERFFMSGPFGSAGGLRLCPAPTPAGSRFLATTVTIVTALSTLGLATMGASATKVSGNVAEVFPTMFMAALLPPHTYAGSRSSHSDDLWVRLVGAGGRTPIAALAPYGRIARLIESAPRRELHDVRTAALSAIAADWFAEAPPGSGPTATTFVGHPIELGFILPPRHLFAPAFLSMMQTHWNARAASLPGLAWI
jgi:hypothetical protein